jgi:hypothetical protein
MAEQCCIEPEYTDCTVVLGEAKYDCHMVVLAQSSFFQGAIKMAKNRNPSERPTVRLPFWLPDTPSAISLNVTPVVAHRFLFELYKWSLEPHSSAFDKMVAFKPALSGSEADKHLEELTIAVLCEYADLPSLAVDKMQKLASRDSRSVLVPHMLLLAGSDSVLSVHAKLWIFGAMTALQRKTVEVIAMRERMSDAEKMLAAALNPKLVRQLQQFCGFADPQAPMEDGKVGRIDRWQYVHIAANLPFSKTENTRKVHVYFDNEEGDRFIKTLVKTWNTLQRGATRKTRNAKITVMRTAGIRGIESMGICSIEMCVAFGNLPVEHWNFPVVTDTVSGKLFFGSPCRTKAIEGLEAKGTFTTNPNGNFDIEVQWEVDSRLNEEADIVISMVIATEDLPPSSSKLCPHSSCNVFDCNTDHSIRSAKRQRSA